MTDPTPVHGEPVGRFTAADFHPHVSGSGARKLATSGVAPLVAAARGYTSVSDDTGVRQLADRSPAARPDRVRKKLLPLVEADDADLLVLPWFSLGAVGTAAAAAMTPDPGPVQLRPSHPRLDAQDRPASTSSSPARTPSSTSTPPRHTTGSSEPDAPAHRGHHQGRRSPQRTAGGPLRRRRAALPGNPGAGDRTTARAPRADPRARAVRDPRDRRRQQLAQEPRVERLPLRRPHRPRRLRRRCAYQSAGAEAGRSAVRLALRQQERHPHADRPRRATDRRTRHPARPRRGRQGRARRLLRRTRRLERPARHHHPGPARGASARRCCGARFEHRRRHHARRGGPPVGHAGAAPPRARPPLVWRDYTVGGAYVAGRILSAETRRRPANRRSPPARSPRISTRRPPRRASDCR